LTPMQNDGLSSGRSKNIDPGTSRSWYERDTA
jgi:hypothetical protein